MSKKLRILLYVIMAWLAILGILFLLFPSIAEKVMSASLPDKVLNMLYGQVALTLAFVAFLAARGGEGLSKLSLVILVLCIGHVIIFGYQLISGMSGFASAGVPLIINGIFSILLILFRRDLKQ
jgi:type IV secretory pathway VirB2 component (pilin)